MRARPIGAYVVKGDRVHWMPSVDATRVVIGGQILAMVALLVLRSIVPSQTRRAKFELLREHAILRRSS
jgi:hypothetical protein